MDNKIVLVIILSILSIVLYSYWKSDNKNVITPSSTPTILPTILPTPDPLISAGYNKILPGETKEISFTMPNENLTLNVKYVFSGYRKVPENSVITLTNLDAYNNILGSIIIGSDNNRTFYPDVTLPGHKLKYTYTNDQNEAVYLWISPLSAP